MSGPEPRIIRSGRSDYHTVVIGSGIAGLFIALEARKRGPVLLVTKGALRDSNTSWAQGGIAAAVGATDSPEAHLHDTIAAGAGLVDIEAATVLCNEAPGRIRDLVLNGVEFDTHEGALSLGLEAAHSQARILHSGGDRTGAAIEAALAASAEVQPLEISDYSAVTQLLVDNGRIRGLELLQAANGSKVAIGAERVVLATGGAGQLYAYTTNPEVATGDGVGLAFAAGAEVADLEFFQFHPTALRLAGSRPFLISEAVRGEGAILRNAAGEAFMARYHDLRDLAPRDVVARAIAREMAADGADHVLLDCTHLTEIDLAQRFPGIYAYCMSVGIDISRQAIPVAPAAHYFMGGVRTDLWGRTTVRGLYAAGEVACTGVHGANRLASNSLMETVVFGKRVAEHIAGGEGGAAQVTPNALTGMVRAACPQSRDELQRLMWTCAGIERDHEGLHNARVTIAGWREAAPAASVKEAEDGALSILAQLLLTAAQQRTESRGAHYRRDYPERDDAHWQRRQVFRRAD